MKTIQTAVKALSGAVLVLTTLGAQAQDHEITYNGEVAKIINDNCVVCHREGGIGPMQFANYEQVRPWAPLIQLRVANREMPPYAYDHGIGIQELEGDWRMDQEEINTIVEWVNQGSPLGDADLVPPAADLRDPDDWNFADQFGQPDLIIASVPIDIPANGNDLWSKPIVPVNVTRDRCLKAVQVKPRGDAKAVVHHANSRIKFLQDDGEIEHVSMLTEYAMGKWGELVPEGVCRTIPVDSVIEWNIHMYPGGVGATAQGKVIENNVVEIGLWFHDEDYADTGVYKQDLALYRIEDQDDLVIPPNGYQMTQGFHSFDHPIRLDSFQPHGHLRMNAASLEIFYPETGRSEMISMVSNWSATWHQSHLYNADVAPLIPAGAVLVMKQWYDNTAGNPNNPDPDQWVADGSRTADEMSHAWLAVTHLDEEGYEELMEEREAAEERRITQQD